MSPASVIAELGPCTKGRSGVRLVQELAAIADRQKPCESALEAIVDGKLRGTKLPEPTRQFWITVFGTPYRVDFAWPELRIALNATAARGTRFRAIARDGASSVRWDGACCR